MEIRELIRFVIQTKNKSVLIILEKISIVFLIVLIGFVNIFIRQLLNPVSLCKKFVLKTVLKSQK